MSDNPAARDLALGEQDIARFEPAVRRYFRRRAAAHEVDDLVQEVFANLYARERAIDVKDMASYLFVVARNVLSRKYRRETRWASLETPDTWEVEEEVSAERVVLSRERLKHALAVIAGLPPRTRQIFIAHRFEDMTHPRIAQQLGISVSAVEKHVMIALKALMANRTRRG